MSRRLPPRDAKGRFLSRHRGRRRNPKTAWGQARRAAQVAWYHSLWSKKKKKATRRAARK